MKRTAGVGWNRRF